MIPTIAKAPNNISFSRNAIDLQLLSSDFTTAAAVTAVNRLTIKAAVPEDATITLNWAGAAALLTAKNAPNDSGTQIPAGDGGAAYVQNLVAWFQGNYFVGNSYIVSADLTGAHPALLFTSRAPGQAFNFSTYVSTVVACGVDTAGSDGGPKENFRHHVELWIRLLGSTLFQKAYDANVPLDYPVTGLTSLDLSDALHAFMGHDEPVTGALLQMCTNSVAEYYFRYAAFYGTDPVIKRVSQSPVYNLVLGGLGKQASLLRNVVTELYPEPTNLSKCIFMRQGSKNILVTPDQPEWLTWLNLTGQQQTVFIEIILHNTDNTNTVFFGANVTVDPYRKVQFQTGFAQLDFANQQSVDKVITYYTITLKRSGGYPLTAAYNYVVDYRYWEWSRYFVYENSYGAYQTLATIGKGQTEFDREKDDAQRSADRISEATTGSFLECNIHYQDKGNVSIGYQRASLRNTRALRSLFVSEKIYLFNDGQLLPVGLNTKNMKDAPDGENVYAGSFEYYLLYQDNNYTEDPNLPDDPLSVLLPSTGAGNVPPGDPDKYYDGIIDTGEPGAYYNNYYDTIDNG